MYSEMKANGHVFWLFGLSSADKTALVGMMSQALRQIALPVLTNGGATRMHRQDRVFRENRKRIAKRTPLSRSMGCTMDSLPQQ